MGRNLALLLLLLSARAAAGDTVWPPPPEPARIRFTGAFSGPGDLGLQKSGLASFFRRLLFGREPQGFVRPYGVAVSGRGDRICVADPGLGAVHVFDLRSSKYSILRGAKKQELRTPIGVTIDGSGRLFVSDAERASVFVFSSRNRLLFVFGKEQGLLRPTGLAAAGGRLYVSDTAAHRVLAYRIGSRSAEPLFQFGGRGSGTGRLNYPVDIAVSTGGEVYVNDSLNFRVQVFDARGNALRSVGHPGDSSGSFQRSKGVALDSDGNLYVVDALFDTVQIFGPDARFLLNFGRSGSSAGELWLPAGLAIDDADRLYVVDSYNRRVQTFQYLKGASR
jgi:DNA-binding beta-propeller fold protein YncE